MLKRFQASGYSFWLGIMSITKFGPKSQVPGLPKETGGRVLTLVCNAVLCSQSMLLIFQFFFLKMLPSRKACFGIYLKMLLVEVIFSWTYTKQLCRTLLQVVQFLYCSVLSSTWGVSHLQKMSRTIDFLRLSSKFLHWEKKILNHLIAWIFFFWSFHPHLVLYNVLDALHFLKHCTHAKANAVIEHLCNWS